MGQTLQKLQRFFRELKRRNVYRVAATYAVVAFVGFQAAKLLIPSTVLPAWTDEFFLFLLIIGFPVAVVVAWAFELAPEGVRRTVPAASPEESVARGRDEGTRRTPMERSLAVLPFTNMGGQESEQFATGVHDDLLTRLSNIGGFRVISRTSVMRYVGTELTIPQIARELGVEWVVEGGVQRAGEEIKVNVQLIDPGSDTHAWADQYRRAFTAEDLFTLQSEITREIADALGARLTPDEVRRIGRQPTEDLEAYRLYVQGRGFLDLRSESGLRKAIDFFEEAIERDERYGPAWSALAEAEAALQGYYGTGDASEAYHRARKAASRALELDPDLADAHASAGFIHLYNHEGPDALREFRRALELEPSLAQAHRWLGVLLDALGRSGAVNHLRRAVELNPMTPEGYADLAATLIARGDLRESLTHTRRAQEIESGYELARFLEMVTLYELGRWRDARSLHREGDTFHYNPSLYRGLLAVLHVAAGEEDQARATLEELQRAGYSFAAAWIHAALGEEDAAFDALRRVEEWGMGEALMVRNGLPGVLESLRSDPRYDEVLRGVDRSWGLNPDGSIPDSMDVSPLGTSREL